MVGKFPAVCHALCVSKRLLLLCLLSLSACLPCVESAAQPGLRAWGYNAYGQLGDGTLIDRAVPLLINGVSDCVALAGSGGHSLALKSDGTVWAWGRNSSGQLGNDLFEIEAPYGRAAPAPVSGLSNILALACGQSHSLALASDGTVYGWGLNEHGQLGDGFNTDHPQPYVMPYLTQIISLAAGAGHSLALKADGTVWMCGYNGNGNFTDGLNGIGRPTQVAGGAFTNVVAIAAGGFHSLALKSDGTVWAWGRNISGQLGDNTLEWRGTPVQIKGPQGVGFLTTVVAIAGGSDHSLALRADGTVWAWGRNTMGQLGDGTETDRRTPVRVGVSKTTIPLTNIVAIAAGGFHNLALKADGTVWTWGYTRYGQTGNALAGDDPLGMPRFQNLPMQVSGLSSAVSIAGGDFHTLVLTAPAAAVSGIIRLEGCVGPADLLTVTLRPTDGSPPLVRFLQPGTNGAFRLANLPRRAYRARIKGTKWLARVVTIDIAAGDVANLAITLPAGDANNDNRVDVLDLAQLIVGFDATPGMGNWNANADFNCDEAIDVLDLSLLIRNFNSEGDP